MIWVNFKLYRRTFGNGALELAKICKEVARKTKVKIIPVVSPLDLRMIKEELKIEVWLQNVDIYFEGRRTGYLSPLAAIGAGAGGTILNHSEHEIPPGQIRQIIAYLKKEKWVRYWKREIKNISVSYLNAFKIMVCFKTKGQTFWLKRIKPPPDFVAYEPPELIGGEISVSQAKAAVIKRVITLLPKQKIIVGAGINTAEDVRKSLQLGAKGVLVSSDVITAKDPKKELMELAEPFKS